MTKKNKHEQNWGARKKRAVKSALSAKLYVWKIWEKALFTNRVTSEGEFPYTRE